MLYIKVRVKQSSEKVFRYIFSGVFLLGVMFMFVWTFDFDAVILSKG